jgi:hypothetical protein
LRRAARGDENTPSRRGKAVLGRLPACSGLGTDLALWLPSRSACCAQFNAGAMQMNRTIKTAMATLALLAGALAPATAQGKLGVSFERRGKAREVNVNVELNHRGPVLRSRRGHVHTDCCRKWIPARCETITDKVWVQPRCERVWVPPVFDVVTDLCGRTRRICLREGYWNTIHHPGRWECVTRQVHVPGRWEYTCGH